MIEITDATNYPIDVVNNMLTTIVPDSLGVSTGPYGTRLHLPDDASTSEQNKAQKIFDNWGNLNLTASTTSMTVGDADPTVTYDTSDDDLNYVVLLDGEVYGSGAEAPVTGTVTLELDAPEAGTYDIYVFRTVGNFASGSVTITVSEA
jgi:hypothetical protein